MVISIILPCYNVREYIRECLMSIKAIEHICSLEVIAVNDGSTDTTLLELNRWSDKFSYVNYKIIDQVNGGLSAARNAGIEAATGDYIFLLDSDDFLNVTEFEALVDEINHVQADIFYFNFYWYERANSYWESDFLSLPVKRIISSSSDVLTDLYLDRQFYAWSKIYKRELFNNIKFPVGRNYEDIATIPTLVEAAQTHYYVPTPLVNYRQRPTGIMKSKTVKNALDLSASAATLTSHGQTDDEKYSWLELSLFLFLWSVNDLYEASPDKETRKKSLKQIYADFDSRFSSRELKFFLPRVRKKLGLVMALNSVVAVYFKSLRWFWRSIRG